jgi:hypothetical protein
MKILMDRDEESKDPRNFREEMRKEGAGGDGALLALGLGPWGLVAAIT